MNEIIAEIRPLLRAVKNADPKMLIYDGKALLKTCTNGASEFVTSIAMSVVSMLYNLQLMKYAGADGVAAYGVLMYVNYIFIAVFIGYSVGTAPLFGYNYGAQNHSELHNLFRRSLWVINAIMVFRAFCDHKAYRQCQNSLNKNAFIGYNVQ